MARRSLVAPGAVYLLMLISSSAQSWGGGAVPPSRAGNGGPAFLLSDLRTARPTDAHSLPNSFAVMDSVAYFAATTDESGSEMWRSDGTPEGTYLFRDLCPGACSSSPYGFVEAAGGKLFFVADDGVHGWELWVSDGTRSGTQLLADLTPGPERSYQNLVFGASHGVYFWQWSPLRQRYETWVSDGAAEGTHPMISAGERLGSAHSLAEVDAVVYLDASTDAYGSELWRSDGTDAGIWMVKDIREGPAGSICGFGRAEVDLLTEGPDGRILFTADDGAHGCELWSSDGSEDGTTLLADLRPGPESSSPAGFGHFADGVYFRADDGIAGSELWRTDGTGGGTVLMADVNPGTGSSSPAGWREAGGKLFFRADDGVHGIELWSTLGDAGETALVADISPGPGSSEPSSLTAIGEVLFFRAGDPLHGLEPWASDGTMAGTRLLRDVYAGPFFGFFVLGESGWLADLGDRVLFTGFDHRGIELWTSDATPEGTDLVLDINDPPASSGPSGFTALHGSVLFAADDGEAGRELWISDGTRDGTALLADIARATVFPSSDPSALARLGERMFFAANDGAAGIELWASDGTAEGTELFEDLAPGPASGFPEHPLVLADALYFSARSSEESDGALWVTDGTVEGTRALGGRYPKYSTAAGEKVFFSSGLPDLSLPRELAVATMAGADGVWSPEAGGPGNPQQLAALGEVLLFSAENEGTGRELWRSDGSRAGTAMVVDLKPDGDGLSGRLLEGERLMVVIGAIAYFAGDDGQGGEELWRSDGTEEGTRRVRDIAPGAASSYPRFLTPLGELLFFAADDGVHGEELWLSDGTEQGTILLRDTLMGAGFSGPRQLTPAGDRLFFVATDGVHGVELWTTNGTPSGTRMVQDLFPGPLSSSPDELSFDGRRLYFSAYDETVGREPWVLNLVPELAVTGTCPGAVAFAVAGATPGGRVALFGERLRGDAARTALGRCRRLALDLERPRLLGVGTADGDGALRVERTVGAAVCGAKLQAVNLATCGPSGLAALPLP